MRSHDYRMVIDLIVTGEDPGGTKKTI